MCRLYGDAPLGRRPGTGGAQVAPQSHRGRLELDVGHRRPRPGRAGPLRRGRFATQVRPLLPSTFPLDLSKKKTLTRISFYRLFIEYHQIGSNDEFFGLTGFYWVLLGIAESYRVLSSFTGFSGFDWVLKVLVLSFIGFYWVFLGLNESYSVLLVLTEVLLVTGFTGFYWVLLEFTWFYLVLLGFTGFYCVFLGFMDFGDSVVE